MRKDVLILVVLVLMSACVGDKYNKALPADTTADDLIPDIEGYTKYDATDTVTVIVDRVGSLGKNAPETVLQIAGRVAKFAACMQARGASKEVGYYDVHLNDKNELVINFAAVGIGDKEEITDLGNLAGCFGYAIGPLSIVAKERVCHEEFTIKSTVDNNEFFIVIMGLHETLGEDSCKKVKEAIISKADSISR